MKVTVVVSTYNHPRWLEKVLWGYESQTFKDFEVIVSDDGSGEETRAVIEHFKQHAPYPILHSWHEDNGYQRQTILNQTLQMANHEYIVMTDGDCVPREDFLEVHVRLAEEGYFLSGGYCKLPLELSRLITEDDIKSGRAFDITWLRNHGLQGLSQSIKLGIDESIAPIADKLTPTKPTWNNCNSSGFTKDLLAVNGYNEEIKYGGSDREIGERLWNLNLKSKQLRHQAVCLHLDHKRGYKDPEGIKKNQEIRQQVIDEKIIQCASGIDKLDSPSQHPRNPAP